MIFTVEDNTITAYGYIWDGDGMEFATLLSQLEKRHTGIILKLHTYGGSVFDGNIIYNALRSSKADIKIKIVGIAASMGVVIALSRENVEMVENGFLMIHAPSGYVDGTATDLENNAKLLRSIEANFSRKLVERTGKTEKQVNKWLEGDNWFSAEEALEGGFITGIISPEADTDLFDPSQMGQVEVFNRYVALLLPKNEKSKNVHKMKKPLIEALHLQGVNEQSSDTAVIDAVKAHIAASLSQAEINLTAEKNAKKALEDSIAAQFDAVVNPMLEAAVKDGRIKADEKPIYYGIAKASGIDALNTVIGNISQRKPISAGIAAGKADVPAGRESWNFDKWQKEDPRGFEALSKTDPEAFQKIVKSKFQK
ncbi:MAG: Clp protease ClpP [Flavobacteriaceae bacterium]|nr:Clp protease ClpP [Flavobacteriaceae bacterium]MDZ4147867.1 Clp protease ClpP [Flavobacteriaceae bacterium]